MTRKKTSPQDYVGDFWQKQREFSLEAWRARYPRSFTWMGVPIEQMPADLMRIQELIYQLQPDTIIETGVQFGGSVLFYASLLQLIDDTGDWRVIGIDNHLLQEAKVAVEYSLLGYNIVLIEGDSISEPTLMRVMRAAQPHIRSMVILDSDHRYEHVRAELEAYAPLVTVGSYLVVCDTIMADLADEDESWDTDNPARAIVDFLTTHPEFVQETPARINDRSLAQGDASHWPGGYLKRIAAAPDA